MKRVLVRLCAATLIACISSAIAFAQPTFSFAATTGGTTPDGGDFSVGAKCDAAGNTYQVSTVFNAASPNDFLDIQIVKYSPIGTIVWTRNYDRAGFDDWASGMDVAPNGTVYVSGVTAYDAVGGDTDVLALSYDANGNQLYASVYVPAANNEAEYSYACALNVATGQLFIAGDAGDANQLSGNSYDAALYRVNANGTFAYRNVYSGAFTDELDQLNHIAIAPNGDVVASGFITDSATLYDLDALIVRITNAGANVFVHKYNSADGASFDDAYDVAADNAGTYVVGLTQTAIDGNGAATQQKAWIRKINNSNVAVFSTIYNPGATGIAGYSGIAINAAGESFVSGWTSSTGVNASFDARIAKFSTAGAQLVTNGYNSSFNETDTGIDIGLNAAGQPIMAVTLDKDAGNPALDIDSAIIGYNPSTLAQSWIQTYTAATNDWDVAFGMNVNFDQSITLYGFSYVTFTDAQALVVRYVDWQTVLPSGFVVNSGDLLLGGVTDLHTSNDQRVYLGNDFFTPNGNIEIWGTSPLTAPTAMRGKIEALCSRPSLVQIVDARRFSNSTWVVLDSRVCSLTDTAFTKDFTGNMADFVGPSNEVRFRFRFVPTQDLTAVDGWNEGIDQAVWELK